MKHLTHRLNPKGESPLYVGPVVAMGGSGAQDVVGQQLKAAAPLKNKRAAILDYIKTFQAEAGYPPTIIEIGTALSMSKTGVHYHLGKLIQEGQIERQAHSARGIKVFRMSKEELHLQMMIAEYLTLQYPGVIFRSDLGGIRLNMGQAMEVKRLQGGQRAFPDMAIFSPRRGYHGLLGEIKISADEVYTKAGELRQDAHTQEQWRMLERLRAEGYKAGFWLGFENAKSIIDSYLATH